MTNQPQPSDTPDIDAAAFDITWRNGAYYVSIPNVSHETVVGVELARKIQRELADARAQVERLSRFIANHSHDFRGDHACAECFPDHKPPSDAPIIPGFRCALHVARAALSAAPAKQEDAR